LFLCFYIVYSCHVSTVLCHITVLWTPVSARILALVLQLSVRNKLKLTRSSAIAEGPRDASCQLKSCQLPRNSAETTYTTSPDRIDGMKLEIWSAAMRDRQCALNNDSTVSAAIVSGVINKPTTVELCISHVYRQLAVAKLSKSTM